MTATHPEYLGVWCPTCKQDCMPMRNGCCGFCDTRVVDADGTPAHGRNGLAEVRDPDPLEAQVSEGRIHPGYLQPQPKEAPVAATCKIDGCDNRPIDTRGPYSGLCAPHKREKADQMGAAAAARRHAAAAVKPARDPVPPPAASNGHTPIPLTDLARAVDQAVLDLHKAKQRHQEALAALREAVEAC